MPSTFGCVVMNGASRWLEAWAGDVARLLKVASAARLAKVKVLRAKIGPRLEIFIIRLLQEVLLINRPFICPFTTASPLQPR